MRFFLFGGARVEADDGARVRLGRKLQQLLALLVLRANQDVSADTLAAYLWGDEHLADAQNSVQEVVGRLRAALGDSSARRVVVTVPEGYRLAADPDSVDVSVFRRLSAAGLAVQGSEPALAELFLSRAVSCARGDLPDLGDGSLADDVYELDRLRRSAEAALTRLKAAVAEETRPRWLAGSQPVGLFVRLAELPEMDLVDVVNEVARVGGEVARLSGGLLVAAFAGVSAALHVAGRLFERFPGEPEVVLGGAVDLLDARPGTRSGEHGVQLATRARPGEILVTAAVQRAAAAARAVTRLDPVEEGLWRIGRFPSEGRGRTGALLDTPLIGRDAETRDVTALIGSSRLVTLRGPGGIGKTRLAIDVVGRVAADYADGAPVVDLADADRHGGLLPAIAGALGFVSEPYRRLLDTILDRLGDRHLLLVLDNCEPFLEEARWFVEAVGRTCPRVTVLATSRSALGASGEEMYDVNPLDEADAVTLLRYLGSAGGDATGEPAVDDGAEELCGLLDGMPLAIECAASMVRAFGLEATAALMANLPDGTVLPAMDAAHGGLGRHQSVERSLIASHQRLAAEDGALFERLSCLRGYWHTEDVGAAVSDEASINLPEALDRLEEASLLKREGADQWRMLEPVRQLAATLLLRRGEQAVQAERHARHFVALAERAAIGLAGPDEGAWFSRLAAAHSNLAAALSWAVRSGAAEPALRLTASLWWYWAATGRFIEGAAALERALALQGDVDPRPRARALVAVAHLSWWAGDPQRTESASRLALELVRDSDPADPDVTWLDGWARMAFAGARMWGGGDLVLLTGQLDEAARLLGSLGDATGLGIALEVHSGLAWHCGDDELAHSKSRDALAAFREGAHQTMIAQGLRVFGLATAMVGDVDAGRSLVHDGLKVSEHLGDVGGMPLGLCFLGLVEHLAGRDEHAAAAFSQSLHLNREAGQIWPAILSLAYAGERAVSGGRPADGARLLAAAEVLTERTGIGLAPRERARVDAARRHAGDLVGDRQLAAAEVGGRRLGVAAAMVLALDVLGG